MFGAAPLPVPLRPGVHSYSYFPSPNLAPSPLPISPSGWIPTGDGYPLVQPTPLPYHSRPVGPAPPFVRPRNWRRASQPAPSYGLLPHVEDDRRLSLNPEGVRANPTPSSQALYRPPQIRKRATALSPDAKPFMPRYNHAKVNARSTRSRPTYIDLYVNKVGPLDLDSPGSISSLSDGMPETPQGFLEIGRNPYQFGNPSVPIVIEDYTTPPDALDNGNVTPSMVGRPIGVLPYSHSPRATRRARQYRRHPVPMALRAPMPMRDPTPGLFLHHDPPLGVPRHSAYRSGGHGGLKELPLPPMRTTPHGGIDFLSWRMANEWGLHSADLNFSSDRAQDFWRKIGEDPSLPGPVHPHTVDVASAMSSQPPARKGRRLESTSSNRAMPGSPQSSFDSVSSLELVNAEGYNDDEPEPERNAPGTIPPPAYLPCAPPVGADATVDSETSYVIDDVPELSDGSTVSDDSDDERAGPTRRRLPSSA